MATDPERILESDPEQVRLEARLEEYDNMLVSARTKTESPGYADINVHITQPNKDKFGRIEWDKFFLSMCFMVRMRSLDPSTKHGCVVVDKDHNVLSMGYNSAPRNCDDEQVPTERPDKYDWMVHSEEAAIANAARNGVSLYGATFYITGPPCKRCLRDMINCGANKLVYGPVGTVHYDHNIEEMINAMNKPLEIVEYNSFVPFLEIMESVEEFIQKDQEESANQERQ